MDCLVSRQNNITNTDMDIRIIALRSSCSGGRALKSRYLNQSLKAYYAVH